ncbi:MAG: nitrate reductase [Planctomycetes bacterium]|nr:nitrate reductase [Planctomycetota bacterium]
MELPDPIRTTRLPPGQQRVASGKWPVIGERASLGMKARWDPASGHRDGWTIEVTGRVARPGAWSLADCRALDLAEREIDIHCVTRWSKLGVRFKGATLESLLARAEPLPDARFVSFVAAGDRNHSTSLPLDTCGKLGVLLVWEADGVPLDVEHGGPVRVVTPGRYFYKSLKWLRAIELLAEDRLGYWEAEAGYHNRADPWREERYLASSLDRADAERLLASRSFAGMELRGLRAERRELRSLDARRAVLRDADFRGADLRGAVFEGANLSNAHFERSDLRGAVFVNADLEGANFEGSDLRSADLRGASLFGATFVGEESSESGSVAASLDATTRLARTALDQLLPAQASFVAGRCEVT